MAPRPVSLLNLAIRPQCVSAPGVLLAATLFATLAPASGNAMPVAARGAAAADADIRRVADLGGRVPSHRNIYRVAPGKDDWDDADWAQIFREADGAFNTAVIDPRRKDFYRQNYFYGGTPYDGRQFYGAPVYYGGPYHTYYVHE